MAPFRFVVIADSHIRLPNDDMATYPSNALMVERNRFAVDLCNRIDAEFVVHLGDIMHPLPVEAAHGPALDLASDVFAGLRHPVHFVPGNHDVGDKPNALVAVPPVAEEYYGPFEERWGPSYRSFDHAGCHFVIVDTPILNSGLERELAQRDWLERDLAEASAAGCRIFLFTHYPPFLRSPDEDEHYDNLAEPARSWLLGLVEQHEVEALFSGHVHRFFYNSYGETAVYVAPATGFVRPDYAELDAVPPEREGGRDEVAQLGLFVVEVSERGHVVRPIRTYGATGSPGDLPVPVATAVDPGWESPVGVTLRHGWTSVVDFPTEGLDEVRRKAVRNDAWLLALWEARIRNVRIPVGDLQSAQAVERLQMLGGRGMRFTVRCGGVPSAGLLERLMALGPSVVRWEVVVPEASFAEVVAALAEAAVPDGVTPAVAPLVPLGESGVHHFVVSGFDPAGGPLLERFLEADPLGLFPELVFRVAGPPDAGIAAAVATTSKSDRSAVVDVALPRAGEAVVFDDDGAVADLVGEAVAAARLHPYVRVFLDGFIDHDRGYYRRHGLVDRRHAPRPALYRVIAEAVPPAGASGERAK